MRAPPLVLGSTPLVLLLLLVVLAVVRVSVASGVACPCAHYEGAEPAPAPCGCASDDGSPITPPTWTETLTTHDARLPASGPVQEFAPLDGRPGDLATTEPANPTRSRNDDGNDKKKAASLNDIDLASLFMPRPGQRTGTSAVAWGMGEGGAGSPAMYFPVGTTARDIHVALLNDTLHTLGDGTVDQELRADDVSIPHVVALKKEKEKELVAGGTPKLVDLLKALLDPDSSGELGATLHRMKKQAAHERSPPKLGPGEDLDGIFGAAANYNIDDEDPKPGEFPKFMPRMPPKLSALIAKRKAELVQADQATVGAYNRVKTDYVAQFMPTTARSLGIKTKPFSWKRREIVWHSPYTAMVKGTLKSLFKKSPLLGSKLSKAANKARKALAAKAAKKKTLFAKGPLKTIFSGFGGAKPVNKASKFVKAAATKGVLKAMDSIAKLKTRVLGKRITSLFKRRAVPLPIPKSLATQVKKLGLVAKVNKKELKKTATKVVAKMGGFAMKAGLGVSKATKATKVVAKKAIAGVRKVTKAVARKAIAGVRKVTKAVATKAVAGVRKVTKVVAKKAVAGVRKVAKRTKRAVKRVAKRTKRAVKRVAKRTKRAVRRAARRVFRRARRFFRKFR